MGISAVLFPPHCVTRIASGHCRKPVPSWGDRCPSCWQTIGSDSRPAWRSALAADQDTPFTVVAQLARDELMAIRMAVAARPGLPRDLQIQLAGDPQMAVLRALSTNPNLDQDIATQLRQIDDPVLQSQLAPPPAPEPIVDLWAALDRRTRPPLKKHQQDILAALRYLGTATTSQIAETLGVSADSVAQSLSSPALYDAGTRCLGGTGDSTRWQMAPFGR